MLVVIIVVLALVTVLARWTTNEYAMTPGNATPVAPLVKISGLATNHHPDKIMLTDVYLEQLSALQYVFMHFQSHVQFVTSDELVEPGEPLSELTAQGYLEMSDAKQAAEAEAFRAVGWKVPGIPTGAVLTGVVDPSPAWRAHLRVGDEIVGVDGNGVDSACQLVSALHDLAPGTRVRLSVDRVKISRSGVLSWRPASFVSVTTTSPPSDLAPSGCPGVKGPDRSFLGVTDEDGYRYQIPAKVSIDTAGIGGPSAGLAMTLTLINQLTGGSLTGHHVIAATGTMDTAGQVGAIGGVAEKAVAVADAGAHYFFVPAANAAAARADKLPHLKIIGVNSLAQALRDLRALGGSRLRPLTKPS